MTPELRGRLDRLTRRQLAEALLATFRERFATAYPVRLVWVRELPDHRLADIGRVGRTLVIRLSARLCSRRADVVDSVLHEYAHAMAWRHERIERKEPRHHPDEFWLAHGRLYRAYHGED